MSASTLCFSLPPARNFPFFLSSHCSRKSLSAFVCAACANPTLQKASLCLCAMLSAPWCTRNCAQTRWSTPIMRVSRCYRIGILFLRGHFCLILLYYFPSSCNRLSMLATCERCYVAHPDHWLSLHAARMRRDVAIASLLPTRDLSGYDNFSLYISFPSTPTKLFPSHSWTSLLNDPSRAHLPCLSLAVRVCVRRA